MKNLLFFFFAALTLLSLFQSVVSENSDLLIFSFAPFLIAICLKPSKK